ncbi:MAG: DUF2971 domain-containing protein [Rickettsiales bacterium]|nr:DUF2971 domain-containing protein [Rickettsiales bacterium]
MSLYFTKYCSAKRAKQILENTRVSYSSPYSFNDPFDMKLKPIPERSPQEFSNKIYEALCSDVHDKRNPREITNDKDYADALVSIRKYKETLSKNEFEQKLQLYSLELARDKKIKIQKYLDEYFPNLINSTFVFSTSLSEREELPGNLLLWPHYADNHRGVALKFKQSMNPDSCFTPKSLDDFLIEIRKPSYVEQANDPFPLDKLINEVLGKETTIQQAVVNFVNSKSKMWSYENELRFLCYSDADKGKQRLLLPFTKDDLDAVFLGAHTSEWYVSRIRKIVSTKYPETPIYRAQKDLRGDFKLKFQLLS